MKKYLFLLLIGLVINTSWACSCKRVGILKGQKASDFVFTGKVIQINEVVTKEMVSGSKVQLDYRRYEFVFEILGTHKGKTNLSKRGLIKIITTAGGADCGSDFELNNKYLVYAYSTDDKLIAGLKNQKEDSEFMTTDICTRTKKVGIFTFLEQMILELT